MEDFLVSFTARCLGLSLLSHSPEKKFKQKKVTLPMTVIINLFSHFVLSFFVVAFFAKFFKMKYM